MKTFKLIFLLALVFFAGTIAGVVATRAVVRHAVREAVANPERVQLIIERRLAWRLRLDNDQRAKLHDILSDTHGQLADLRRQYRPQVVSILGHADSQITALLTPAQQDRYEKFKQENRPLLQAIRMEH
jgi:hypothetical protein